MKRIILVMMTAAGTVLGADGPAKGPSVRVTSVRRIFHNGEHNAFTDLCRFRGEYYLTFRSCPDGHMVHPTSSIIILTSHDGEDWRPIHRFSVPLRDTRDPHFMEFQGKLFVFTGTWYCGETSPTSRDLNEHLGYAVFSEDGASWRGPVMMEGTYGHYIWRAAAFQDKAYLCGRRKRHFARSDEPEPPITESALLTSTDGLVWSRVSLFQEEAGDETAFLFEPDGSILAIARDGRRTNALVCRSKPPYTEWSRTPLDRQVGGPLIVRWGPDDLVGGRNSIGAAHTSLYWLIDDALHEFAELPSAGDNSYPGFVAVSDRRAWVSYYSSHEKDAAGQTITAIYLAELERQ